MHADDKMSNAPYIYQLKVDSELLKLKTNPEKPLEKLYEEIMPYTDKLLELVNQVDETKSMLVDSATNPCYVLAVGDKESREDGNTLSVDAVKRLKAAIKHKTGTELESILAVSIYVSNTGVLSYKIMI